MEDYKLIGACGLYCGGCDSYRASLDEGKHLLKTEKFENKNLEDLTCNGCHSDKHTKWCSVCKIRLCAKQKEITHCGVCSDFPCGVFNEFYEGGKKWAGAKHRNDIIKNLENLKVMGNEKWLEEQKKHWKCSCGFAYTYYEKNCDKCEAELESYATTR